MMNIGSASYRALFSADEKYFYNVGGSVRKFEKGSKPNLVYKIDKLKNPSEIALSKDEKYLAVLNTQGHIAVYNANEGKLIAKTKALQEEGYGIFFSGNNLVVTSTWNGNIIIFDYVSNNCDAIKIPDSGCGRLMNTDNDNVFLLFYNYAGDEELLRIKQINLDNKVITDINVDFDISIETKDISAVGENYYFIGSLNEMNDTIWKFGLKTKKLTKLMDIPKEIKKQCIGECICVNKDETMLAIGYGDMFLYDLKSLKLLNKIESRFLSCCLFFNDDRNLYIGTWSKGFSFEI